MSSQRCADDADDAGPTVPTVRRRTGGVQGGNSDAVGAVVAVGVTVAVVGALAAALVGTDVALWGGLGLAGLAAQGGDDAVATLRRKIERFRAGEAVTFETDRDGELGALTESVAALAEDARSSSRRTDRSEGGVRRVHERITDGFFAVDEDWTYTDVNEAGAEMVGESPADIVGERVWEVFPDLRDSAFEAALRRAMEDGETASAEAFYPPHDSWYSVTAYPTADGIAIYFEDVTERTERERQLAALVENTPNPIYIKDCEGHYLFVNQAAADLFDLDAQEMVGKHDTELFDPGSLDGVRAGDKAVVETESVVTRELETTIDGERHVFLDNKYPYRDADGSVVGVMGISQDITERKARERELRERERTLSTLMDNVPGMVYRCRNEPEWPFEFVSDGCQEVTGYDAETVESGAVNWAEEIVAGDNAELWAAVQDAVENREPFEVTYEIETADGERRWLWEQGQGVYEDGDLEALEGVIMDVTEQRERERELRETNERLNAIIEASPDAIVALDGDGTVEVWNPAAERIFGWDAEDVVGGPLPIVPDDRTGEAEQLVARMFDGETIAGEETKRQRADGTLVDVSVSAAPLRDEVGDVVGIMAALEDVTERKARERELQRTRDLLQQAGHIANIGGWELDVTTEPGTLTWTDEMYRLHGIDPGTDVDVETALDYYHPDDRARIRELLERTVEHGESYDMEARLTIDAARPTWVRAIGEPVFEDGDVVGVRGSVQDITEHKEREHHLEVLRETARDLLATAAADAAAERVRDAAADLLADVDVAVYLLDSDSNRLEPVATTEGFADHVTDAPITAGTDAPLWEAFVSGDRATVEKGATAAQVPDSLALPVGGHGLLVATPASSLGDGGRRVLETLAATAETALDRIDTEENLRKRDAQLAAQNRRLRRQIQITDIIRRIDRLLIRASNREDIEQAVCDGLVETDDVAFVWIGTLDATEETVVPRTWAGDGEAYLDTVTFSTTGQALEPAADAAGRQAPTVVENVLDDLTDQPWREQALASDFHSVVSVPLAFEDYFYGVLTVYADEPGVFGDLEEPVFAELGENIAHSINAAETHQALYADTLVELTLELDPTETPLGRGAELLDSSGTFEGLATYDDEQASQFFTVPDAEADDVAAVLDDLAAVREYRHVDDTEDGPLFEATVTGPSLPARLIRHGGRPRSIHATPTTMRAVVQVPPATDVREFIGMLAETYPSVELVGRRTVEGDSHTRGELVESLFEGLTDRQREVLRTAYLAGYFEWPRRSTGEDVAEMLGVSQPTINRHLRVGQQRLLAQLFDPADVEAADGS